MPDPALRSPTPVAIPTDASPSRAPVTIRVVLLTSLALLGFAANSLLCRGALGAGQADAASFTGLRLLSGAAVLWLLARPVGGVRGGSWASAFALFAYAGAFSFAYLWLGAGVGALLLFGAVQVTMIGAGIVRGDRPGARVWCGSLLATGGLAWLTVPGARAPSLAGSALMLAAGAAWGVYSLRGRRSAAPPLPTTAANFLRSLPFALALWMPFSVRAHLTAQGATLAVASGALASGVGYSLWYAALPSLRPATAAIVQLLVPVIAASAAVALFGEAVSARFAVAAAAILGGVALAVVPWRQAGRAKT